MANYLITGVSSGIGRELTKKIINNKNKVFGVARRKELLLSLKKDLHHSKYFDFLCVDITNDSAWKKIIHQVSQKKFLPDVVIFNAAIFEKDYLEENLDFSKTRRIFETNFFSVLKGFEEISKIAKRKTQFLFVSSSSAIKGSGAEGVGYPASKAAMATAFESLYLKYHNKFQLKIIYLGPVRTEMLPFSSRITPTLSKDKAVYKILKTLKINKPINYAPWHLFIFLRLIKILPGSIYLTILHLIDILHIKTIHK